MRALCYESFGGPLTVRDLPEPVAPDGAAVVRVEAAGLCRSDWHGWKGHDADITRFPHVPGHEFAGTVAAVGAGVDPGWVGRRVSAPFVFGCGSCEQCGAGDAQVCAQQEQPGFSLPGCFAELVVVTSAATNLVPLPDGLEARAAAGLGCRVATAHRAVRTRARAREGEVVLVLGCGGVGLSAVAMAAADGARVVAVDVAQGPLDLARRVGAAEALLWSELLADQVWERFGGAHVSLDCIGSAATCEAAIRTLRRRGRHVQVGLLPPSEGRAQVPMELVIAREIDVLGSHGLAARDYPPLLDDVASGRLDLAALLDPGPVLTLEEVADALPAMGATASSGIRVADPVR